MHVLQILCLPVIVALCHTSPDTTLNDQWELWKSQHEKMYTEQREEAHRRLVWENNLRLIEKHNREVSLGLHSFTMGLNHFADKTEEELDSMLNCLKEEPDALQFANYTFKPSQDTTLPDSVDWRTKGLVSPVRDQGSCGSCWAFATVGTLEGQMARKNCRMIPLSPQNLMDCSVRYGNHGCKGGHMRNALNYVIRNKGIDSDQFYPYKAKEGKCRYSVQGKAGHCSTYRVLPWGDEKALQYTVATVGPVAVSIDATHSFVRYGKGIYHDPRCTQTPNHAVLVVGYGTHRGQDYWLVKNSWGTDWGENGYVRMARNKKNLCGIANQAIYPVV
ncbi:cathepsin S-like [Scleropages formosus]|uniref:Cathepsin S-like n=1 Tax=Scleropages formosus TaxID=113540 RepID=A0A8C9RE13_SCLFO|nr:cathepsin S-like [Scleropages formosus]